MATPGYTGKGLQAPRTEGRALQALSQFGQQEQIRNSQAIQQGVRDRDKFADMLKVDPVYATSQGLQQKIASSMDRFQDEMTEMNKSRRGVMTTEDLMKMQQSRGRVMAEMQHYKAIDDQMLQGGQMVNQRPDIYDSQLYDEAVEYVRTTGEAPPQGFVFKAVQDPFIYSDQMLKANGMGWVEEDIFTGTVGGVHQYEKKGGYKLNDRSPTDTVNRMLKDPQLQYHVQLFFDRLSDGQRERYISQAGGNETAAANQWYRDGMIPELSRKTVGGESEKTRAAYKPALSTKEKEEQKTYQTDDGATFVYDGDSVFFRGDQNTAITGSGDGMSFHSSAPTVSIPADKLKFNTDIEFDPGSRIEVQPQQVIFSNDGIEYSVDPTRNGDVWVIAATEDDVPLDEVLESIEITSGKNKGKIKYRGRLKAITASGQVKDASSLLDVNYGGNFSRQYNQWKAEGAATTAEKTSKQIGSVKSLWSGIKSLFGGERALSVVEQFMKDNPQVETEEEAISIIEAEVAKGQK